jgi:hypothetical protein
MFRLARAAVVLHPVHLGFTAEIVNFRALSNDRCSGCLAHDAKSLFRCQKRQGVDQRASAAKLVKKRLGGGTSMAADGLVTITAGLLLLLISQLTALSTWADIASRATATFSDGGPQLTIGTHQCISRPAVKDSDGNGQRDMGRRLQLGQGRPLPVTRRDGEITMLRDSRRLCSDACDLGAAGWRITEPNDFLSV